MASYQRKGKLRGPTPRIRGKKCCVCGKPVYSNHSLYCRNCKELAVRMSAKRLPRAVKAMIWAYIRRYGYVCYYTGMDLVMDDRRSPWYCVLDHWIPHNNKKVVLTSALINEMKSALTEKEFRYFVGQLYNHWVNGVKFKKKNVKYWLKSAPCRKYARMR